jgi:outer membrane protein OmpA-like peptidoglycan-associated protein
VIYDERVDLSKIISALQEYATMKVDVRSHADRRQTKKHNGRLFGRSAKSTVERKVQDAIDASRLTGKGYGDTPVNKYAGGVHFS